MRCQQATSYIEEFIEVKRRVGKLQYANLSIAVSDSFMAAVEADDNLELRWPATRDGEIRKIVAARDLWRKIADSAWASGDPGLVFLERYNNESNTGYFEELISVNPCGEQGLPAWGWCNLGSINLAAFFKPDRGLNVHLHNIDWAALKVTIHTAVRMLDNVIDLSPRFLGEKEEEIERDSRRVGLGTMGLADFLIKSGVTYGSERSLAVIDRIYEFIRDEAYNASIDLAKERGSFPEYHENTYLNRPFVKRLPESVRHNIKAYGIRNAVLLTQAPTGTTSLLARVSSGIEPNFDFVYRRKDKTGERLMVHPDLEMWASSLDLSTDAGIAKAKANLPPQFVSANEVAPAEHIRVQATIQKYTDSSISKTINCPNDTTVEAVEHMYRLAYDLGCKGLTVFRDGSRDGVLERVDAKPEEKPKTKREEIKEKVAKKKWKRELGGLSGKTYKVRYMLSGESASLFVTVNGRDDDDKPIEVFVNGKGDQTVLGTVAWTVSKLLQAELDTQEIVDHLWQFRGTDGGSFNPGSKRLITSVAQAIAYALDRYLVDQEMEALEVEDLWAEGDPDYDDYGDDPVAVSSSGDVYVDLGVTPPGPKATECPKCHAFAVVREMGCPTCKECGWSRCG